MLDSHGVLPYSSSFDVDVFICVAFLFIHATLFDIVLLCVGYYISTFIFIFILYFFVLLSTICLFPFYFIILFLFSYYLPSVFLACALGKPVL